MTAARYEPSRPFGERTEHPFAGQFTNYWAWRFADALEALATSTPIGFRQGIAVVSEALAAGDRQDLAAAWRAFVVRKIGEITTSSGPHLMGHPEGLGGLGTDWPRFRLAEPARPFMRDVGSEPWGLPPAADVLVPLGWVTEPAGTWERIEVDVVYDPRRHEVMFSPPTGPDRKATFEAAGWRVVSADRMRVFWTRDRSAATRAALDRLGHGTSGAELDGWVRATAPIDRRADGEHDTYEAGQRVRWKQRGQRWRYGHLGDPPVERDGNLRVFEDGSGSARTLRPGGVERQVRGPRGGRRWVAPKRTESPPEQHASGVSGGPARAAKPPNRQVRSDLGLGR